MISYTITNNGVKVFINGEPTLIEQSDYRYDKVLDNLRRKGDEESFIQIFNSKQLKETVKAVDEFADSKIHPLLVGKIEEANKLGLPLDGIRKFCERLSKNPFKSAVEELFDFLNYRDLPITEDGHFLAYKGVGSDGWSVKGNTDTIVVQGKTDDKGRIFNELNAVIEVLPSQVDPDRNQSCSWGLHVGSMQYARNWANKVFVVKVDPACVVSVPTDCYCQKCRVYKYEIIDTFSQEIVAAVVNSEGESYGEKNNDWFNLKDTVLDILLDFEFTSDSVPLSDVITEYNTDKDDDDPILNTEKLKLILDDLDYSYNDERVTFSVEFEEEDDDDEEDDDFSDVFMDHLADMFEQGQTFISVSTLTSDLSISKNEVVHYVNFWFNNDEFKFLGDEEYILFDVPQKIQDNINRVINKHTVELDKIKDYLSLLEARFLETFLEKMGHTVLDGKVILEMEVEDALDQVLSDLRNDGLSSCSVYYLTTQVSNKCNKEIIMDDLLEINDNLIVTKTIIGEKVDFV